MHTSRYSHAQHTSTVEHTSEYKYSHADEQVQTRIRAGTVVNTSKYMYRRTVRTRAGTVARKYRYSPAHGRVQLASKGKNCTKHTKNRSTFQLKHRYS